MTITHLELGTALEGIRPFAGEGSAEVELEFGSFRFDNVEAQLTWASDFGKFRGKRRFLEVADSSGDSLGLLSFTSLDENTLALDWAPIEGNRTGFSADCTSDDHFMGAGSHAQDVDHVGEAFALWVSEPGIGKTDGEEYPEDWFLVGTKHASSFPFPFLLRPQLSQGLWLDTSSRVEVDLCSTDADRFQATVWDSTLRVYLIAESSPIDTVAHLTRYTGRPDLPKEWVFGPWLDAIRGSDRVREVAQRTRQFGAPANVIWSEDWKGAEETGFGYHLTGEWFLDETLYPDARELATALEEDGFKWFAYFSPFIFKGTVSWDEALESDVIVENKDGEPYTFLSPTFNEASLIDLSTTAGREWFQERMRAALDIGFDGWMADYAEWLPLDAALRSSMDANRAHNIYPQWWQETNAEVLDGTDSAFFVRSGWSRTGALVPVVWAGDQRTDFQTDDGFPSVLPLGLGLAVCGVPIFTHDVAGYASATNPPSTKELWFRWAWLGAFTPILRTHHGAEDQANWQFDTDDETTEHWVKVTREHMRLFPYRYGLANQAAQKGIPMILPVSFVADDEDWARHDAWMLGDALLIAPVLEEGALGREVSLPSTSTWFDWFTHEPAESGFKQAQPTEIPVFARAGSIVPTFDIIPDTLVGAPSHLTTLAEADQSRTVYIFDSGGSFTEADGTTYRASGTSSGPAEVTVTLTRGATQVGGLEVIIESETERQYRLVVVSKVHR